MTFGANERKPRHYQERRPLEILNEGAVIEELYA